MWTPLIPLGFAVVFYSLGWGLMTLLAFLVAVGFMKQALDADKEPD
jgi:hypothetical protein